MLIGSFESVYAREESGLEISQKGCSAFLGFYRRIAYLFVLSLVYVP